MMMMRALLLVVIASLISESAFAKGKQPPAVSPNFSVDTNEVDGTGDDETTLTTIVQQTIAQDVQHRRSNMIAKGPMVNGALQQVKRCDLSPTDGWFVQASGIKVNAPESWVCTNTTIDVVSEQPSNCVYNNFWTFGRDMKYVHAPLPSSRICLVFASALASEYFPLTNPRSHLLPPSHTVPHRPTPSHTVPHRPTPSHTAGTRAWRR